ncbi:helix-turn-helix transcriptional regulator [Enterobacillus tribolii]|uniref:Regulatory LuxR family protein n=1 Tax=Enterobacillus tribolii TaxID=1487935 RepID=A0A370QEG8_9GAMM|nr:helix-turn-helix transcriptional regulator [Enterobacillus tribolii]MBW7984182.1 helix-turn-helix transcriptional regulator [Enterobacillus tribolii]RDK86757.1 hypothetical protein C8D90_11031 [Enterobacillus tribolii]
MVRYYFISDNRYFLAGIESICKDTGLMFTSVYIETMTHDVNISVHREDVAIVYLSAMMQYQDLLSKVYRLFKTVLFIIDGEIEETADSSTLIPASMSGSELIVTLLKASVVRQHIPQITDRGRVILEGLYRGKSVFDISQRAQIREKSVYALKRNLLKQLGLGKMNSACGLAIAYNTLVLQIKNKNMFAERRPVDEPVENLPVPSRGSSSAVFNYILTM